MKLDAVVHSTLVGLVMTGVLLGIGSPASAEEVYTATLVSPRGIRADKRAQLTLTISSYATEEDAERLKKIYAEKGSDGLIEALRATDRGTAVIKDGPSRRINHVRVHEGEGGSRIIIVTDGPLYFPEDTPDPRTMSSLGVIQLDLNKQHEGGGTLATALKIRISQDGVLEVEGYTSTPIRLEDVEQVR